MTITNGDMRSRNIRLFPGVCLEESKNKKNRIMDEFPVEVRTEMEIIPHLAEWNGCKF